LKAALALNLGTVAAAILSFSPVRATRFLCQDRSGHHGIADKFAAVAVIDRRKMYGINRP
jgi:hypothetical protein